MDEFMKEALAEARKAKDAGEIPVGAVIVRNGEIIARGHNTTEMSKDPTSHAEMNAIREASKVLGGWRLIGCDMYVTLEPCCMCAGALVWARIENLYIGASDPKAGACGSLMDIPEDGRLNHTIRVHRGIMENECSEIVREFFRDLRIDKSKKSEETVK
jgi:tRNA(adenine34) deaminase